MGTDNIPGNALDSCLVSGEIIHDARLHALVVTPTCEHSQKHFHPVLGLCPACAGVDRYNSVSSVIRLSKEGEKFKEAPYKMPVRRLDDVKAARQPDLKYEPGSQNES